MYNQIKPTNFIEIKGISKKKQEKLVKLVSNFDEFGVYRSFEELYT